MVPGRPRLSLLLALAFAGATLLSTPAFAEDAGAAFQKGNAAFEDSKYEEALAAYQEAWKVNKSHTLAYMMGRAEMELRKLKEAAEHFAYAKAHFPLTGDPDIGDGLDESIAEVKKHVATVRILSTTKDVTIVVDGVKLDSSALGTNLYFEEGKHTIEASAPGFRSARRPYEWKGGDDEQVTLNLTEEGATPRNPIPGYVMGGVGIVGLVVGGVLVGMAEGKKGDAQKLHDEIGTAQNCVSQAEKCKLLRDTTAAADTFGNGGIASFVFGGLFTAAGAAYVFLPSRKSAVDTKGKPAPTKAETVVAPWVSAQSGGVFVSGSF